MIFNVEVKTEGETLQRGDLVYEKRTLLRVERICRPRRALEKPFRVIFRIVGKIDLNRQLREDRAL